MDKQDYINQLSLLDVSTLARLYRYSQLLIIPDQDLLLNVNMSQMVDKAHELADAYFPEWQDRGKSDFGEFLVELMALFSEKDYWYVNAYANESELANMSLYRDAFVRAINMGYRPVLCGSSSAYFDIAFQPGAAYTYGIGELAVVQPVTGYSFTNNAPVTVPSSLTNVVVPLQLFEGAYLTQSATFDGHSINLPKKLIDVNSIILTINNVVWTRVDVFGQSTSGDAHYLVLPGADGSAVIFFGEDGYGLKPNLGDTCIIKFRQCNADAANGAIQVQINVGRSSATRPVVSITQTTESVDGTSPESLAQLKNNAPLYKSTKSHCYNQDSTQKFLNALPYVKQSYVNILGNKVYFYIIPTSGVPADTPLLNQTSDTMEPYLMNGYFPFPQTTPYTTITPLNMTVSFLKGTDPTNGMSLVRQLVEDYTNPLVLATYGGAFDLTALSLLLRSRIPGLQNVIYNTVAGTTPANVVVPAEGVLQKLDQSQFTLNAIIV